MDLAALLVSENGRNVMAEAYAFTTIWIAGRVVEVGPFRVTAFEMTHIGVYSLGYRIEVNGHTLAYTGDTGPCDEVDRAGARLRPVPVRGDLSETRWIAPSST